MPYYRNGQPDDGFDDFEDFDDMTPPAEPDFDDFDDSGESFEYSGEFDDFDDEPAAPQRGPAPQPYYAPDYDAEERQELEFGPAKRPSEFNLRRFLLTVLAFLFVIAGAGVSAHYRNGFVPADILTWNVGSVTIGELLKITSAEDLIEHTPSRNDDKNDETVYTEDNMPDSVRYADFDIYEGNTYCTVKGYNGTELQIALPASYNGKPCTHIEANAFSNSPVTAIEIPDSYTYIGQTAFSGCSITDLYLPDSITEIGWGMCSGNKELKSVRLPNSLEIIPEWAFANCVSLTKLEIPGNIKTVGQWAFTDCTSVSDLKLNEGIVTLDNCAFYGCTALPMVLLPESVTSIGQMCFRSCTSLMIVSVPESLEKIGKNAFMNCSQVLTLFGKVGSKWETYADKNDLSFDSINNLDLSESDSSAEETLEEETPAENTSEISPSDASASDIQ